MTLAPQRPDAGTPGSDLSFSPATDLAGRFLDAMMQLKADPSPARITSDEDAIAIALAASLRADCTRRQVGAAIFDIHGRCVATGRNGAPSGYPGCLSEGACPRGQMSKEQIAPGSSYRGGSVKCVALHAEKNALLHSAREDRRGGLVSITAAPCDDCSLDLAGSGLARAIWPEQRDGQWVIVERLLGPGQPIGDLYA